MAERPVERAAFAKISHTASIRTLCSIEHLDAIILDTEHGAFTEPDLEAHCALIGSLGRLPIVRVARPQADLVARALDRGAGGVMVPQVDSVAQAAAAVRGLDLAPTGARGWDPTVAALAYGAGDRGPAGIRCFVQIETREALEHAREIAAIPGVTDLFVGPADLSRALGSRGEIFTDAVIAACEDLAKLGAQVTLGLFVDNPARAAWAGSAGFSFLAVGSDVTFLRDGARRRFSPPADVSQTGY